LHAPDQAITQRMIAATPGLGSVAHVPQVV